MSNQSLLNAKRQVKSLKTITQDLWGKTGRVTEIREYKPEPPPVKREGQTDQQYKWTLEDHHFWESRRKKNTPTMYFLRFWVPCRMTGVWLTEEQMEEV